MEEPYVLTITRTQDSRYWRVKISSASELSFDLKVKNEHISLKEICKVAPYLARLDMDMSEAYDDAFRTQPKQFDMRRVREFVEKNDFINVDCDPFCDLGFHGDTITSSQTAS